MRTRPAHPPTMPPTKTLVGGIPSSAPDSDPALVVVSEGTPDVGEPPMKPLPSVEVGGEFDDEAAVDVSLMLCEADAIVVKVEGDAEKLKEPLEKPWLVLEPEGRMLESMLKVLVALVLALEEAETEAIAESEVDEAEVLWLSVEDAGLVELLLTD